MEVKTGRDEDEDVDVGRAFGGCEDEGEGTKEGEDEAGVEAGVDEGEKEGEREGPFGV